MDDDKQLPDGDELPRISTGNAGLDNILGGGIDPERMYLFEGQPGSGKTTLALEFLLEGVRAGEPTLYMGRWGQSAPEPPRSFTGTVDDVALYSRALVPEEVAALARAPAPDPPRS